MCGQRKTPSDELLAGEISERACDRTEHQNRLLRLAKAKTRTTEMAAFLRSVQSDYSGKRHQDITRALTGLEQCGDWLEFRDYYTVQTVRLAKANFCKNHWLCPLCAIRRAAQALKAYVDKFEYLRMQDPSLGAYMVTLTVKNGEDLEERFEHLRSSVRRLLERRRDFNKKGRGRSVFNHIVGLVGSYEFTNKGNGWHPHVHIVALAGIDLELLQAELSTEWKKITGDSHIVDIRPMCNPDDPGQDFVEVFKYAVKFSDLDPSQNFHLWSLLKGSRLMFSAGAFWGVKVPEVWADEQLDGLPYVRLLYKYLNGRYKLSYSTGELEINAEASGYGD